MVGGNSGPSTSVENSPLVEAIITKLEQKFSSPSKSPNGKSLSRWKKILDANHHIQNQVVLHDRVMAVTNIQLYELNQTVL